MTPRLQSILVLCGVFALGGVTGGALTRYAFSRHKPEAPLVIRQRQFIAALDKEVELEPDQRAEVRAIMAEHEPEIREIRHIVGPRMRMLRATALDEIRRVMRPDQLPHFQRFVEKQEARAHRFDDDPPADGQDYPGGSGFPGRQPGR